jgi:hypothetical protein
MRGAGQIGRDMLFKVKVRECGMLWERRRTARVVDSGCLASCWRSVLRDRLNVSQRKRARYDEGTNPRPLPNV